MHQIGNSFTRLTPGIEFADNRQPVPAAHTCHATPSRDGGDTDTMGARGVSGATASHGGVLAEPAPRFASIHSPALLNAWHSKLQAALAEPVQLEQRRDHRRVSVLGTAIFDFDAKGLLQVSAWDFDENNRVRLSELPADAVVIQGTPYQALWMQRFKLGALRALLQSHPGQVDLCRAYVDWAQAELEQQLWTADVQERVRYQVAVGLDLDVWALSLAGQIQLSTQPQLPLRADAYNHAIRYRKSFEILQKEAPQLVTLYALIAPEMEQTSRFINTQLTAWMRRLLGTYGVSAAMWRLLCRVGTDWMTEFLAYYQLDEANRFEAVIDLLTIAEAFGTEDLVPAWLLRAFIQLGGNPNAPTTRITSRLNDMFGLCRRLGQLAVQADVVKLALFRERAQDICRWASDHFQHTPKDFTRRATLRGLLRRVDAQDRLDALSHESQPGWRVPYQLTLAAPEVQAVILDSPLSIWQEGQRMRHCADKYLQHCKTGAWVMVSLRSAQHSRALATVAFGVRDRQVSLRKIAGFANTLVSPEVMELAQECQRQLQAQRQRADK